MKKLIALLILTALSGCLPSAGWKVSFGATPVTAIDDNQQFSAADHNSPNIRKASLNNHY